MSAASIAPDETLELRLKALRLSSLLAHYVSLAERAAAEGWSNVRYLAELITLEANERADRRITRLLNEAKLHATRVSQRSIWSAMAHHSEAKSASSCAGSSSPARPTSA
jgi:DNA replication protein DnaC